MERQGNSGKWAAVGAALVALLVGVPTAGAVTCTTGDQAQTPSAGLLLGQAFELDTTTDVAGLELVIGVLAGDATVDLVPTAPAGPPLADQVIASVPLGTGAVALRTVTFERPQRLAAGSYAVLVHPPAQPGAIAWTECVDPPGDGAWIRFSDGSWFHQAPAFALGLIAGPPDLTPPAVTVTGPPSPTAADPILVTFAADESPATFSCALDGAAAAPCDPPLSLAGLADGPHAVVVRATDQMGNESDPATASFVVDRAAPAVTVAVEPGRAGLHAATLHVTVSEEASLACTLDAVPLADCTDGALVDPLSPGAHTVTVIATDAAGNAGTGSGPFTADWEPPLLTLPGDLQIAAEAPEGALVDFETTATDGVDPAPMVTCVPPSGSLFAPGATVVACTATDAHGNEARASFTILVTAPPPTAAEMDVAFDPETDKIVIGETHGGEVERVGRRLVVARVAGHETIAHVRRINELADVDDLDDGLRISDLAYDGGPVLHPARNGYAIRISRRDDGSLRRVKIVARAGRTAVIVSYSGRTNRSVVRWRDVRTGETLRVIRSEGLIVPHLQTDGGRVRLVVPG